jgi:hypothetical protein
MNTYRASLLDRQLEDRLGHVRSTEEVLLRFFENWGQVVNIIQDQFAMTYEQLEKPLSMFEWSDLTRQFFQKLFPNSPTAEVKTQEFLELRQRGTGVNPDTLRGWLDAATEYWDWCNIRKEDGVSRLFGFRANAKQLAFEMALAKVS